MRRGLVLEPAGITGILHRSGEVREKRLRRRSRCPVWELQPFWAGDVEEAGSQGGGICQSLLSHWMLTMRTLKAAAANRGLLPPRPPTPTQCRACPQSEPRRDLLNEYTRNHPR